MSATRCQGSPALLLGLGRGGFTIQFTPAGNIQNHPRAAVYKAPEFAGGRSRVGSPTLSGSRPAPASGRRRPHEEPSARAENRALPGPRSCRGLRTLDRSVRWRARRPRCGQKRRPPGPAHRARGAPRPPEGHRGRAPAGAVPLLTRQVQYSRPSAAPWPGCCPWGGGGVPEGRAP